MREDGVIVVLFHAVSAMAVVYGSQGAFGGFVEWEVCYPIDEDGGVVRVKYGLRYVGE